VAGILTLTLAGAGQGFAPSTHAISQAYREGDLGQGCEEILFMTRSGYNGLMVNDLT
jgi:hypothetical protein